jgi:hypothetical protein
MKKNLLPLLLLGICLKVSAQISNTSVSSNSLTISPNGIVDNRPQSLPATSKYIAIGDSAMFSNVNSEAVVSIGYKSMVKSTGIGYSVAIGDHAMYNSEQGYGNIAIGSAALYSTNAFGNIGIGMSALYKNSSGINNLGVGSNALYENVNGTRNLALGSGAMRNSKSISECIVIGNGSLYSLNYENPNASKTLNFLAIGNNVASRYNVPGNYHQMGSYSNIVIGNNSFSNSLSGENNVTLGVNNLLSTTNSSNNTAIGIEALRKLQNNNDLIYGSNSAMGHVSLFDLIYGSYNTAVGVASGNSLIYGNNNTFLGTSSGVTGIPAGTYVNNAMALGFNSKVNSDNKVVIGDAGVVQIGGYATWSNYSDRRLKENITYSSDLGLSFINQLKTARYNYIEDKNKNLRDGLIAQDVQEILKKNGWKFSGLIEDNDKIHTLNLSYTEFVIPLINAVKELSTENEKLKSELQSIKGDLKAVMDFIKSDDKQSLKSE